MTTIFFYIYRASFKYIFKQIIEVSFMGYISYGPHPIRTTPFGVGASSKLDGSPKLKTAFLSGMSTVTRGKEESKWGLKIGIPE